MTTTITFLGAAGTVTGSKYLVENGSTRLLIDAGMFQGDRKWNDENWREPEWDPRSVQAVLLTHAHIDHIGVLPRLSRLGLKCPIYATAATTDCSKLLLRDSARLQEEDAEFRAKKKLSRFAVPLPLYTVADAEEVIPRFRNVPFHQSIEVAPNVKATWRWMGHILGAASIELEIDGKRIIFSGDIGRYNVPILKDPEPVSFGDVLLIESTYGDKLHGDGNPEEELGKIIRETHHRHGVVLIPSFAVGRTQSLLFYLRSLKAKGEIPDIPVVIDSPMANEATKIYVSNFGEYDNESKNIYDSGKQPFVPTRLQFAKGRDDSIALNDVHDPMILIAASGMLTGGRIMHHLRNRISDPRTTLLFVGHQPAGGKGDWIMKGNKTVRLFGSEYPIRAEVRAMSGLSAHADKSELLRWCNESKGTPGKTYVVHGDPEVADAFSKTLEQQKRWSVKVPQYLEKVTV